MVETNRDSGSKLIGKLYIAILLVIFGGIVLHTPISVWLGGLLPDYGLIIKAWKEVLMGLALVIAIFLICKNKRFDIFKNPFVIAIGAYGLLHLAYVFIFEASFISHVAGLMIDLRYLLFFLLVFVAVKLYPASKKLFIKVGIVGALLVTVFSLLQVFVLPVDFLKHLGYSTNTIAPYLTIDQNHDFIRINSTMRGPNPLGAYAVIILACLGAWAVNKRFLGDKKKFILPGILLVGGLVSLWFSYSRSALIAMVVSIAIIVIVKSNRISKRLLLTMGLVTSLIVAGTLLVGGSFFSNVILHDNPQDANAVNSNEGHVSSLESSLANIAGDPLGSGVGSTGSASLLGNNDALFIENQYLFVAHEVGWLGLIMFLMIFIAVMVGLWQARTSWLALGLFASGAGMAIIGVLLPVWVDDMVSIIWWGLAAVVIGGTGRGNSVNKKTT